MFTYRSRKKEMEPNRLVPVKGRLFYFAAVSLLALLTIFEDHLVFGGMFLLSILVMKFFRKATSADLVLLLSFYFVFIIAGYLETIHFKTAYTGNEKSFLILFDNQINVNGDSLLAYATALPSNEKLVFRYRIESKDEQQTIKTLLTPGIACRASGNLKRPSPARNPNAFDYKNYLQQKNISWILEANKLPLESCYHQTDSILTPLKSFRQNEVSRIETKFPEEASALAAALIFGERDLFDPETERFYQKVGIVHLLAISGLHVGLLTAMAYFVLIRVGVTKEKAETLLLIFLPFYAILTGLAPPVIRSASMLLLLIGSRRLAVRITPLDAVSIAFLTMAFFQPAIIYDIGFQLSFAVSFSLVLSAPIILKNFNSFLKQTAAASLIAQLASLPVILSSFYEISVVSIFANLLFVPLFSFVLLPLLLFTYVFFLLFRALPSVYLGFLEVVVHHVNLLAEKFSDLPFSTIIIGKLEPVFMIGEIFLILWFFFNWEGFIEKSTKPPHWIFVLPFLPLVFQSFLPYINPHGQIIFLDVGQGDSIFIRLPYNQGNYLIDTGGVMAFEKENWQKSNDTYDPGKKILVPFLKSEGVRSLDKLILTHGDADHIGGAIALFDEIHVKQLILPRGTERSVLEKDIINIAVRQGTAIYSAGKGTRWSTGEGVFSVLNPSGNEGDRNDQSIVLHATVGGKKWLFTGDLGFEGERRVQENFRSLKVDVLKLGHHGSKYSSSDLFLEMTQPEYAVISVGAKNRYGHPAREVIERLEGDGIKIFRTDTDGAVIYKFKGDFGTFSTQIP